MQFPLGRQNLSPHPVLWFPSLLIDSEAWGGVMGLHLQYNGIIVVTSGGSIPSFRNKASRPVEHEVVGTGSKTFASRSLGMMVTGAISTHWFLDSWTLAVGEINTIYWMFIQRTQTLSDSCPTPARYCHLAGTITHLKKAIPLFYQASCFRMVGNMVRTVNPISMGPTVLHLMWSEFLDQKQCYVPYHDEAFCKSLDGRFGWSFVYNSKFRVSVSGRTKHCLFHWGKPSKRINLPPSSWLITLGGECCCIRDSELICVAGRLGAEQWP